MHKRKKINLGLFIILIVIFLGVLMFVYYSFNALDTISEVKSDKNIGKRVTIEGKVTMSFKISQISGYFLEDATDKIRVSSQNLPAEGEIIKVTGILKRDSIFGYYLEVG